jgi:hypothetical protein
MTTGHGDMAGACSHHLQKAQIPASKKNPA